MVFIFAAFFTGNDLVAETRKEPARLDAVVVTAEKADDEYKTGIK